MNNIFSIEMTKSILFLEDHAKPSQKMAYYPKLGTAGNEKWHAGIYIYIYNDDPCVFLIVTHWLIIN